MSIIQGGERPGVADTGLTALANQQARGDTSSCLSLTVITCQIGMFLKGEKVQQGHWAER